MKITGFPVNPFLVKALASVLALILVGCASNTMAPVVGREGQPATVATAPTGKDVYTVKAGDTLYSIAREHGMDFRELIALNSIENPNVISVGRVLRVKPQTAGAASGVTVAPVSTDVVVAKPIASAQVLEAKPLAGGNTEMLKREPKAGKEPYSEQALALARSQAKAPEMTAPVVKTEAPVEGKPEAKPAETPVAGTDEIAWIWPANGKIVGTYSESGSKGVDIAGKVGDAVIAAADGKVVYTGVGLRGYGKLVILKHNSTYLTAYAHNQNIVVKEGQTVSKGQKIAEMGSSDADQVKLHFEVRRQGKPVDPQKYLPPR